VEGEEQLSVIGIKMVIKKKRRDKCTERGSVGLHGEE